MTTEDIADTYDAEQVRLMGEMCIVVDEQDNVIRPGTKKECHLMSNINTGLLHRAFSVFVFNEKNELMLQGHVDVNANPNEVQATKYVSKQELVEMFETAKEKNIKLTPWFKLIVENFLYKWWDNLDNLGLMKEENLEFLDLSAGIKKTHLDDDFDYIYHLPTADPSRIIPRDPFRAKEEIPGSKTNLKKDHSMAQLSMTSKHSIKQIRSMLDPTLAMAQQAGRNRTQLSTYSKGKTSQSSRRESLAVSTSMSRESLNPVGRTYTRRYSQLNQTAIKNAASRLDDEYSQYSVNDVGEFDGLIVVKEESTFRAMPDFVYNYCRANYVAAFSLLLMLAMVIQVIIANV
ncbi:isopentenyl-diphosphate delta-isomerase idi1 [Boothiomyces sp. JEL0838]|nr:isopentenyl-diphosphate delta-isomerase idi1 [Boothiomyces sp. JEL0838]